MTIGEIIRSERKKKGYTQEKLGRSIGYDHSYVSKIENGKPISKNDLARFAEALESTLLMMLARGTTTHTILFRGVQLQFLATLTKAKEEYQQAIEAIDKVLHSCINLKHMDQATEVQEEDAYHMLGQVCNANIASDCVDLVMADMGADIERRNRDNEKKYREGGYDPWVLFDEELRRVAI